MSAPVAIDFETYYSKKKKYGLKQMIAETYCQNDLFDPYMLSVYDGSESWVGHPRDFNWAALNGRDLLAHNAYFELTVLKEMQAREMMPRITPRSMTCTANMTAFLCNRRDLASAAEYLLKAKMDKTARGDADGKKWPGDFSENERSTMLKYALTDARRTHELFTLHGHRWPTVERELSRITIDQGMRGVQIDVDLLNDYTLWSYEMLKATEKVIPWMTDAEDEWDEFTTKPTSSKCVAEQCRRSGIPCPPVKSDDEEGYLEWEQRHARNHPWILALGSWRSINRLYKTFLVMKSRLRPDGTMPFALLYFGAHTGRWAGTAKINFQNMRKEPVFQRSSDGLMETDEAKIVSAIRSHDESGAWPIWVGHVIDFRALIVPRSGKNMIVSDLSQIEPRVLAWLTGNTALLEMVKTMSLYEAHARNTLGWTGGPLKNEDKGLYALAKARVLGLGYGAGWEKFIVMAKTLAGLDIAAEDPEWETVEGPDGVPKQVSGYGKRSREIVNAFRAENKPIVDLWQRLDGKMKQSVGGDFVMNLPSGRQMRYEHIRAERRTEPDPETGRPRSRSVYTAQIGFRRTVVYGGKLTENITQAVSRDVFGEHIVALDKAGMMNLFSSHDEAILETDKGVKASDVRHIMSQTPAWIPGLPLDAEAQVVDKYKK